MKRPPRPKYERSECSVPDCKRGTTTFPPGTRWICGRCWRKAPKDWRVQFSTWGRRARAFDKREMAKEANACWWKHSRVWERVLALLTAPPEESEELPPLVAEQLRKDGLL